MSAPADEQLPERQITAVLALAGPERYSHFVKRVADEGVAWGLYDEGGALFAANEGAPLFPLWPAREYAQRCAVDDWSGYRPREITIDSLLDELLPSLHARGTGVTIFPVPAGKGIVPELSQIEADLRTELSRIE